MYGNILVPVDGSSTSVRGLDEAIKIARKLGSRIRLLHIVNELIFAGGDGGIYATDLMASLRDGGKSLLAQCAAQARRQGVETDSVMIESMGASAADHIVEQARHWPADLIVMGTHGRRGLVRFAMGSDAESVVRIASVPVLLVRNAPPRHESRAASVDAAA
ncbi:MAG TPA: universal stress protein [Steroidobacteraceae bacterium]|nr:universal stress protein [Steroidobacteraceae bacterium]